LPSARADLLSHDLLGLAPAFAGERWQARLPFGQAKKTQEKAIFYLTGICLLVIIYLATVSGRLYGDPPFGGSRYFCFK
jgi:hypothetical protein